VGHNHRVAAAHRIPVLEVGGTHVTAALVDATSWEVCGRPCRLALDGQGSADAILGTLARAGSSIGAPAGADWGVAIPDPFDYERGVGLFRGVAKFESLYGVDVRAALSAALPAPAAIRFVNDADAFTLGEWRHGAASGAERCLGITLGTGVGSGWVAHGRIVDPGTPPGGRIHRVLVDGTPLEEHMSRRAIRHAYSAATGDERADVKQIAERASDGDGAARSVLEPALRALGSTVSPLARGFGANVVVVGGSMTGSWPLLGPWFREGLGEPALPVVLAANAANAPLVGAAAAAQHT
jgi:glucokinase